MMSLMKLMRIVAILAYATIIISSISWAGECQNWQATHPEWLFCDDFEDSTSLVRQGRYFEYDNGSGSFILSNGVGLNSSKGMKASWQLGQVNAGALRLAFGRNPVADKGIRSSENFREIYYRMYVRTQAGWIGDPVKLSRATIFSASDWSQAMIAHLWSGDVSGYLGVDPVRCVDGAGNVICSGYNDFAHMTWLGLSVGKTPIYDSAHDNLWYCVEAHVRLNDPGQSNGMQEFLIDGQLEARKVNLNFVGSYSAYGINSISFENYWNTGSIQQQERYFDNIVVSMHPIGCLSKTPTPPTNLKIY